MRKLIILFAVLAGLFAFQGSLAEALPGEKARTELVVKNQPEEIKVVFRTRLVRQDFILRNDIVPSSPLHLFISFLISSQYFHSGL